MSVLLCLVAGGIAEALPGRQVRAPVGARVASRIEASVHACVLRQNPTGASEPAPERASGRGGRHARLL